jgi:hypothetical protein
MTFSEFGRRIKSNASTGTDHGAAAPLFVFGASVNGGVLGANPVLPSAATTGDNITMQFDFRAVYAGILRDWFGATVGQLQSVLPGQPSPLPIIRPDAVLAVEEGMTPQTFALDQNYPNPFNGETRIGYRIAVSRNGNGGAGNVVRLKVYDVAGKEVATLVDGQMSPGQYQASFNASGLSSGVYFYRLEAGGFIETKRMVLVR